jgi:hypothetical protein
MMDDKGQQGAGGRAVDSGRDPRLQGRAGGGHAVHRRGDEATARQVAEHRSRKAARGRSDQDAKVSLEDLYQQIQSGDVKELQASSSRRTCRDRSRPFRGARRLSTDEVRLNRCSTPRSAASPRATSCSPRRRTRSSSASTCGPSRRQPTGSPSARVSTCASTRHLRRPERGPRRDGGPARADLVARRRRPRRGAPGLLVPGVGAIAGCYVLDGKVTRNATARLVRDHVVVYDGQGRQPAPLQGGRARGRRGFECGIGLENYRRQVGRHHRGLRDRSRGAASVRRLRKDAPSIQGGRGPAPFRQDASLRCGSLRVDMVVGVVKLTLYLPENHSLKGKRGVIKKIKARVANSFNVSVAECDAHDCGSGRCSALPRSAPTRPTWTARCARSCAVSRISISSRSEKRRSSFSTAEPIAAARPRCRWYSRRRTGRVFE